MNEPRLRIVQNSESPQPSVQKTVRYEANGQLELDLGDEHIRRILVAAMDRIHGAKLHALLAEVHPVIVMDLRSTIRFDIPGTSRNLFLENVSKLNSCYMRSPIEWNGEYRSAVSVGITLPGRLHHEIIERHNGNVLLLVNKAEQALHISSMINVTLSQNRLKGWDIEQAV